MKYEDAKQYCHVRSAIFRTGDPVKLFTQDDLNEIDPRLRCLNEHKIGKLVPKVYWYNDSVSLDERIPDHDKKFDDWEEYDPRDREECSQFNEMPA